MNPIQQRQLTRAVLYSAIAAITSIVSVVLDAVMLGVGR